jgi:serine/threonine protein kinase
MTKNRVNLPRLKIQCDPPREIIDATFPGEENPIHIRISDKPDDKKDEPTLILEAPLTPGVQAKVQSGKLCWPDQADADIEIVRKQGGTSVRQEIEIHEKITTLPNSPPESLLRPIFWEKADKKNALEINTLCFPLMPGGNLQKRQKYLFDLLKDPNKKGIAALWIYEQTIRLLEALDYLHSHGIVHGDIKLDNLLINNAGDSMLADLGCAFCIENPLIQGSVAHRAPEVLAAAAYPPKPLENAEKLDIWALGICFYILLHNEYPISLQGLTQSRPEILAQFTNEDEKIRQSSGKNSSLFFQASVPGDLYRREWGKNYHQTPLAARAKEATQRLNAIQHTDLTEPHDIELIEILNDISLAMLSTVDIRPSASDLLKILKKLKPNANEYNQPAYRELLDILKVKEPTNANGPNQPAYEELLNVPKVKQPTDANGPNQPAYEEQLNIFKVKKDANGPDQTTCRVPLDSENTAPRNACVA